MKEGSEIWADKETVDEITLSLLRYLMFLPHHLAATSPMSLSCYCGISFSSAQVNNSLKSLWQLWGGSRILLARRWLRKKLRVEEMIDKSQRGFKSCLIFILKAVKVFTDQHGPRSFNYFAVDNLFSFSCLRGWAWEGSQQVYIFYGLHLPFHYMHRLLSPQFTVTFFFSFFRAIAQRGYTSLSAL